MILNQIADISVVLPCYNSAETIVRALNSIKIQTLSVSEIIVVDDKSTDDSIAVVEKYIQENPAIKILLIKNEVNMGPGFSRNVAWDNSEGTWIAFLDADDSWHPRKIEIQMEFATKYPDVSLLSTLTKLKLNQNDFSIAIENPKLRDLTFKPMLFKNSIFTRTVILKRDIPYRFRKGLSEDYGLWLQCLESGLKCTRIESELAYHHRAEFSNGGLSARIFIHELYELRNLLRYFNRYPLTVTIAVIFSSLKFVRRFYITRLGR